MVPWGANAALLPSPHKLLGVRRCSMGQEESLFEKKGLHMGSLMVSLGKVPEKIILKKKKKS